MAKLNEYDNGIEQIPTPFEKIGEKIANHQAIFIHIHTSPDFDALASMLMTIVICKTINPQASIKVDEDTLKEIRLLYGKRILLLIKELIGENAKTNENQDHQTKHSGYSKTLNIVVDTHPKRVASSKELLTQIGDESSTECIVIDHHINDYPHPDQDTSNNVYYVRSAPSNSVLMYKLWEEIKRSQETGTDEDEFMLRLATLGLVGDNPSKSTEELKTLMQNHNIPKSTINDNEISSLLSSLNPSLPDELKGAIDQINDIVDIRNINNGEAVQFFYIQVTSENKFSQNMNIRTAIKKMGDVLKSKLQTKNNNTNPNPNIEETKIPDYYDTFLLIESDELVVVKIFNHGTTDWNSWLKSKTNNQSGGHKNDAAWTIQNPQDNEEWQRFRKLLDLNNKNPTKLELSSILEWFYSIIEQQRKAIHSFIFIPRK